MKGYDSKTHEQRIEAEYPLETPQGVSAFLSNYHYIRTSAYDKSDYDAIIMLIDFEIAFSKISITDRQREAINLVYGRELTQREAGEIMGISQQAVQQLIQSVVEKISKQYAKDLEEADETRGKAF